MSETQRVSQKQAILSFLMTGERLTDVEARRLFGCGRIAARIYELKQDGHRIISENIRGSGGKYVASYRLVVV